MNDILTTTTTPSDASKQSRLRAVHPPQTTEAEIAHLPRRTARPSHRPGGAEQVETRSLQREHARERRSRILHAATVLWAEQGMLSDSIRTLADKAQVAPATIYNLAGNREETLTEIMIAHIAGLTDRVSAAADAACDAGPTDRLEAMLTAFLSGVADQPHAHLLIQHGMSALGPHARDRVRLRYRELLELMAAPLSQLAPSLDRRLTVSLALAAVGAAADALLWFDPTQELEVPATARRLTAMLLAAGSAGEQGPRPGCGGPVAACARAWLMDGGDAEPEAQD